MPGGALPVETDREFEIMRLHQCWTRAAVAFVVLTGAAFADVTVSQSNDPTALIGSQFASLLGAEHTAMEAMPEARLAALAIGPEVTTRRTVNSKPAEPVTPAVIEYTDAWLAAQTAPTGGAEWNCLKTALYFESRGESLKGQFAVAEVVLNRRDSGRYPTSVCGVVNQGGNGGCQFSFNCDGARDVMYEKGAAWRAGQIAAVMLAGAPRALTAGATYFHTRAVSPSWARRFERTAAIGAHLFYRQN
jgi:spore germination cell wall hydrolase CwlJ-like protein